MCRARVDANPAAGWIAQRAKFDAEHDVSAASAAQGFTNQQFVMAAAIKIARVDQIDAGVERGVDCGNALGAVGGAIKVRHAHRAKANGGNGGAVFSKTARHLGVPLPGGRKLSPCQPIGKECAASIFIRLGLEFINSFALTTLVILS
jgi:hypothetical protein